LRLLLDTHIALWAISDDPRLSDLARSLIADPENPVFVSIASLWEIGIKYARARGRPNDMPIGSKAAQNYFQAAGYHMLPVSAAHVHALQDLPPLHNDPFDRMLLAQAFETPLRLLTRDHVMPSYGDYVLSV